MQIFACVIILLPLILSCVFKKVIKNQRNGNTTIKNSGDEINDC